MQHQFIFPSQTKYMLSTCCALGLAFYQASGHCDTTTEILAQKGVITADEYAKIRKAQNAQASIDLTEGLKVTAGDKTASAQIGTLLQLDAATYDSDISDTSRRDLANSGSDMRCIRLYINGTFLSNWDYRTEIEFANSTQLTDGYLTYRGLGKSVPLQLTVGHFKIPFSQESLAPDKGLTFMERSLPNAFLNARAPGLMLAAGQENWSSAFMIFGEQLATAAAAISDEGGGVSWRSTWAPWIGPGANVHIGLSFSERIPSQNNTALSTTPVTYTEGLRLRSKPESNIIETRLVDTGTAIKDMNKNDLIGLELAASWHSINFNAEFIDN